MLYIVHNRDTGNTEQFSQEQLDTILTSGKFGRYEVIDEIDDRPFTLPYKNAQTLNECMASLWELVAYSKSPFIEDGTALTHQELIQHLETILPQMDQALTPSDLHGYTTSTKLDELNSTYKDALQQIDANRPTIIAEFLNKNTDVPSTN